ncbi:hypothetical protein EMCRGX_G018361 [Ephydatia muelleri]
MLSNFVSPNTACLISFDIHSTMWSSRRCIFTVLLMTSNVLSSVAKNFLMASSIEKEADYLSMNQQVVMLSSAQPLNHIYVTMSKQAHTCNTCTMWVQGSSILIKDDGTGTDTENKR